jgi:hypothetical protein
MNFIIKSPKYGEYTATVDDEDYELVSKYNWTLDKRKKGKCYGRASVKIGVNKFSYVYLHRLIMGFPENMQIDHKDNNGLNNVKSNLRLTPIIGSKNQFNMGKPSSNTSGFKGVHFIKALNKYEAYIGINSRRIFLGFYDHLLKAAFVYNEYCKLWHGEFGKLNEFTEQEISIIDEFVKDGFKPKEIRRLQGRGLRGVSRALKPPIGRPYTANVMVNKKKYNLGYFKTEVEAAKAYNEGLVKYGGDLRKLNKIPNE